MYKDFEIIVSFCFDGIKRCAGNFSNDPLNLLSGKKKVRIQIFVHKIRKNQNRWLIVWIKK